MARKHTSRANSLTAKQYDLEYRKGTSSKFWSIRLDDCGHTIQYGPIGSLGQVKTKEFSVHEEAVEDFTRLVQSKLNKGYVKSKQRVKSYRERWLEGFQQPAWFPKVRRGDGGLTDSKYSGQPWLGTKEKWPRCPECANPLQLMLQLNLSELPAELGSDVGKGLLQFFMCAENDYNYGDGDCDIAGDYRPFSPAHLIRIVQPKGTVSVKKPEGLRPFPAKRIVGWTLKQDFPHPEEYEILGYDSEADDAWEMRKQLRRKFECLPGDKLRGWPFFVQSREYPRCPECGREMRFVYQLDSGTAKKNLPYMFGDNGAGHIMQCPRHKKIFAFSWACC